MPPVTKKRPGRPRVAPDEKQSAWVNERVTTAQRTEYDDRGGKRWLIRELSRKPRK